ncbi:hypothetical protein GUJ93_ZPchr0010g7903 [Zizania palustris]|uniref:Uncharacterized protein n=1 Tax=Zizania palustris TaxID=103762 RepID=A0A8J5W9X4_ZIZPA|nr:hypothetical protein GUJ93_ZPchr0010g7903 [Zizania palustris]
MTGPLLVDINKAAVRGKIPRLPPNASRSFPPLYPAPADPTRSPANHRLRILPPPAVRSPQRFGPPPLRYPPHYIPTHGELSAAAVGTGANPKPNYKPLAIAEVVVAPLEARGARGQSHPVDRPPASRVLPGQRSARLTESVKLCVTVHVGDSVYLGIWHLKDAPDLINLTTKF